MKADRDSLQFGRTALGTVFGRNGMGGRGELRRGAGRTMKSEPRPPLSARPLPTPTATHGEREAHLIHDGQTVGGRPQDTCETVKTSVTGVGFKKLERTTTVQLYVVPVRRDVI
jgi:hypothetical protein